MRYGSRLEVNLTYLADNCTELKRRYPDQEILFMVKANGYGHGAVPVTQYAFRELGIKHFGCASLGEAIQIRDELPDDHFELYVFSDIQLNLAKCREAYVARRIIPVIGSIQDLTTFLEYQDFSHFPLMLKFNVGMNRLGLGSDELEKVVALLKQHKRSEIHHVIGHLACSSLPKDHAHNQNQVAQFGSVKSYLADSGFQIRSASLANSGALEQGFACAKDLTTHIRPGLMMYGPSSLLDSTKAQLSKQQQWNGKIISKLETSILKVFKVEKGTPIGYGATSAPGKGYVAIIPLGYGDGLISLYRGCKLHFKQAQPCFLGRINMDMAQLYFSADEIELKDLKVNDPVIIWDHDPKSVDLIVQQTGMIPYELFCQLSSRVPRIYQK